MESIETRLSKLEKSLRRYQLITAALVMLLVTAAIVGFHPGDADIIRARSFVVVNDSGRSVGKFTTDNNGGLLQLTSSGNIAYPKVLLSVDDSGGGSAATFGGTGATTWQAVKR